MLWHVLIYRAEDSHFSCGLTEGRCALAGFYRLAAITYKTDAIQAAGWMWRGIVVWHKPSARPMIGEFRRDSEFIVYASKGKPAHYTRRCFPGVIQCPVNTATKVHITGKPLALVQELMEIVKLIGSDVLPDSQKVVIETARVIRTGFLQQNAFHKNDTYVPLDKQMWMMEAILHLYDRAVELVDKGVPVSAMAEAGLFDKLVKVKYEIPNDKPEMFGEYNKELDDMCAQLLAKQTPAAG